MKQALKQQEEEEILGHRRKRKLLVKETETEQEKVEKDIKDDKKEKDEKPKSKKKSIPPPIDFTELLKIAEKKQHEPIVIDVKPKNDEPERLMTKKQMKEYAKEKEWRERKEQRNKLGNVNNKEASVVASKSNKTQDNRNNTNCNNKVSNVSEKINTVPAILNKIPSKVTGLQSSTNKKPIDKINLNKSGINKCNISKVSERDILLEERKKLEIERKKLEEMRQTIEEEKKKLKISKTHIEDIKNAKCDKSISKMKILDKQDLLKNAQKESLKSNVTKCRISQTMNDKIKQFPPADLKSIKSKHVPHLREQKKSFINNKRKKNFTFNLLNWKK